MEDKSYHLYLTNYHTQESHSLNICSSPNLDVIKEAVCNMIRASFRGDPYAWWYAENKVDKWAMEMTQPFVGLLNDDSPITKRKYPFYHLGFIITNYPMWPDGDGGYEKDFYI